MGMKASYDPYSRAAAPVTCNMCGRILGMTFHFTCHVCGAAYCYIHMPETCNHGSAKTTIYPAVRDNIN